MPDISLYMAAFCRKAEELATEVENFRVQKTGRLMKSHGELQLGVAFMK